MECVTYVPKIRNFGDCREESPQSLQEVITTHILTKYVVLLNGIMLNFGRFLPSFALQATERVEMTSEVLEVVPETYHLPRWPLVSYFEFLIISTQHVTSNSFIVRQN